MSEHTPRKGYWINADYLMYDDVSLGPIYGARDGEENRLVQELIRRAHSRDELFEACKAFEFLWNDRHPAFLSKDIGKKELAKALSKLRAVIAKAEGPE